MPSAASSGFVVAGSPSQRCNCSSRRLPPWTGRSRAWPRTHGVASHMVSRPETRCTAVLQVRQRLPDHHRRMRPCRSVPWNRPRSSTFCRRSTSTLTNRRSCRPRRQQARSGASDPPPRPFPPGDAPTSRRRPERPRRMGKAGSPAVLAEYDVYTDRGEAGDQHGSDGAARACAPEP